MHRKLIFNHAAFLITAIFALLLISQSAAAQPGNGRTPPAAKKTPVPTKTKIEKTRDSVAKAKATRTTTRSKKAKPHQESVAVNNNNRQSARKTAQKPKAKPEPEIVANERTEVAADEIKLEAEPAEFFPIRGMLPNLNASTSLAIEVAPPKRELEAREDRSRRPMPIVKIQQVSVEPNVFEDDVKGVLISVKFKVSNLAGAAAKIVANFYPEKTAVSYDNVSQTSANNFDQLFVEEVFTPATNESYYSNFSLFMPYEKLEQAYQNHPDKPLKIKMQIQIRELDESILASSNYTRLIVQ